VNNAPSAAGLEKPGELLSLVMDGLSGSGLDVRPGEGKLPGHRLAGGAVHPGGQRLRPGRVGVLPRAAGRPRPGR